ncbi:DUF2207 domain-containing protein [Kineococcus sp. SYSU DK001]|uniref:DUF2207 domain-containing protein n=1 Tax=Kineococcus sp. SYSU DK001 TaxID=3383122 RepID=UPI003D7E0EDD
MRSVLLGPLAAIVVLVGPLALPAAAADGERVVAVTAGLTVQQDGSLRVREEVVYDFGDDGHHGLERVIPVRAPHDRTHDRSYPVQDLRVESPTGAPTQVETETDGDFLDVRVGDPDSEDVRGEQTYVLTYTVPAVADARPDGSARIAWDAVGTGWQVPIDRVEVTLDAPAPLRDARCTAGDEGSTRPCDTTADAPAGASAGTTAFGETDLGEEQGVTVSATVPAGVLTPAPPILLDTFSPALAFAATPATLGGAAAVLLAGALGLLGLRRRRDPAGPGVPADVTDLPPGVVGAVAHRGARDVDVVATLLDLAQRGHLAIEEVGDGDDWSLHRRETPDPLRPAEQRLLSTVFAGGPRTSLSAVRTTARTGTQLTKEALEDDAVARGLFSARPARLALRRVGAGLLVTFAGAVATVLLALWTSAALVGVAVVVVGLVLAVVGLVTADPLTVAGAHVRARAGEFATTLTRSAAPERFTRLVPYAVALDATGAWAAGARSLHAPVPTPPWYSGRAVDGSTFNVALFAGTMGGFSASTSDALSAAPPSTAGSSSGSTYTGGGAGGGGGGSW